MTLVNYSFRDKYEYKFYSINTSGQQFFFAEHSEIPIFDISSVYDLDFFDENTLKLAWTRSKISLNEKLSKFMET